MPSVVRCLFVATVVVTACTTRSSALDPERTLTQCFQRIWQVQQGLPRGTIYAILQTSDGHLWLGTQAGLVRFDGVEFTSVPRWMGRLPSDTLWVRALCEDAQHRVWIATEGNGLFVLSDGVARRFAVRDDLPSDDVRALVADRDGVVWIGTSRGLARAERGRIVSGENAKQRSDSVNAICRAADGTIWIGGSGSPLRVWRDGHETPHPLKSIPERATVEALKCAADGTLWVGTTHGLVRLKDGEERLFTTADGLADNWIHCLAAGSNDCLWLGTEEGFTRLHNDTFESFRKRDGLSQSSVYVVAEDREGSLWVGTKHGLNQFCDRRTVPLTVKEGLPSNDTGPVLQDETGDIWVGTLGAGLVRVDGRKFTVLTTSDGMPSGTVLSLAAHDGELWVGTDRGVCRVRDRMVRDRFGRDDGLPSDSVLGLCCDKQGNVWAGTSVGLAQWRDGKFAPPAVADEALKLSIIALTGFHGESLFFATDEGGLYRLAGDSIETLVKHGSGRRNVSSLYEDPDGLLWMATRGDGLRMYDGSSLVDFTMKDGLYDDDLFGMVADDHGHLWIACSKGLFYVNRAQLRLVAKDRNQRLVSTPFSPLEALRTIECQDGVQPGVTKTMDGRIWFSTIRGLIFIDPQHLRRVLPPTPVVVEEVIVNGRSEQPDRLGKLGPGLTNLEFRYAALSFVSPSRMTYRYQLEGFDQDWIEAGSRHEAFYTNLPPGDYRFRVGADNVDETFHEITAPVAFTIRPQLYQRAWFLPLCGAVVVLAIWGGYRWRLRQVKQRMQVIVAERSRIARELHDTLMQGFSGVTMEMQALAAQLPSSQERSALEEIIADAGTCLRDARRSIAGLRHTDGDNSGLAMAIAQAARQIAEPHDVRLKLQLERAPLNLPADVQYNVLRIAQEAITNAVKHSNGRNIEVALERTVRELRLRVRDDGVGFDAEKANRNATGHYGLIGMRERANQIGGELHLSSAPGRGTTLMLVLPMNHSAGSAAVESPELYSN
ncbi:MAG TPA: two-component regulator propeller domain-containing protein [Pirellulales bacterium]|jgi:signal transduction histidine kinase/ligand-binding sensor domain-containing protein|nr:two-component regulator propeller domain-containing protein [Pirellulales bacterium]